MAPGELNAKSVRGAREGWSAPCICRTVGHTVREWRDGGGMVRLINNAMGGFRRACVRVWDMTDLIPTSCGGVAGDPA